MERQLRQILEGGLHATLNAGLRRLADTQQDRSHATPMPCRLLLGGHDIEAFTTKMARWPTVRNLIAVLAATGLAPEDPIHAAALHGLQWLGPRRRRSRDLGSPDHHDALRGRCQRLLPAGPSETTAIAWAATSRI
jgi:hypothetical protein